MQRKAQIFMVFCLFLSAFYSGFFLAYASTIPELTVSPERIVLTLPSGQDQEYRVSSTQNPRKIIVDSNVPFPGFESSQKIADLALKEIRVSQSNGKEWRMVLEFNYQVPEHSITQAEGFFQLEIPKTFVQTSRRRVEAGVIYGHQRRADTFGPNVVNYLEVDLLQGVQVKLALAQNRVFGSEHVSTLGERMGAIAAVNGAFFASNGRPLGVLMIDGELISEPYANRTALGLGPEFAVMGQVSFEGRLYRGDGSTFASINGLNRPRLQDELIVYTAYYGTKTNTNAFGHEVTIVDGRVTKVEIGNSSIPKDGIVISGHGIQRELLGTLKVGDELQLDLDLKPDWSVLGVDQIIGGGPRLVEDGQIKITGVEERFQDDVLKGRAPRTALGITADQKLLLVTVNGRQPNISVGMTLHELGNLLIELGAVQAMNLDGGGSTTMVIRNLVLNLPSDGKERPVSNGIVVITSPK